MDSGRRRGFRGNRERAPCRSYKGYLARSPDDARGWFRLAWTQMATLGQFDESAKGFKEVIRLQPNNPSAHVNLASAYSGMRDFEAAIPAYQKSVHVGARGDVRHVRESRVQALRWFRRGDSQRLKSCSAG